MLLDNFKRLTCGHCKKLRHHEVMFGMAKCVTCGCQRLDAQSEPLEIEHFIG